MTAYPPEPHDPQDSIPIKDDSISPQVIPDMWWSPSAALVFERHPHGGFMGYGWVQDELPSDAVPLGNVAALQAKLLEADEDFQGAMEQAELATRKLARVRRERNGLDTELVEVRRCLRAEQNAHRHTDDELVQLREDVRAALDGWRKNVLSSGDAYEALRALLDRE